ETWPDRHRPPATTLFGAAPRKATLPIAFPCSREHPRARKGSRTPGWVGLNVLMSGTMRGQSTPPRALLEAGGMVSHSFLIPVVARFAPIDILVSTGSIGIESQQPAGDLAVEKWHTFNRGDADGFLQSRIAGEHPRRPSASAAKDLPESAIQPDQILLLTD